LLDGGGVGRAAGEAGVGAVGGVEVVAGFRGDDEGAALADVASEFAEGGRSGHWPESLVAEVFTAGSEEVGPAAVGGVHPGGRFCGLDGLVTDDAEEVGEFLDEAIEAFFDRGGGEVLIIENSFVEHVFVDAVGEEDLEFSPAVESAPEVSEFAIGSLLPSLSVEGSEDVSLDHFLGNGAVSPVIHGAFGIPDVEAVAAFGGAFFTGDPVVVGPVPGGSVDVEEEVVGDVGDIGNVEEAFPIGGGDVEAGDHVIPGDLVSFGDVVVSFELEDVPLRVGIAAVEGLEERFAEALDHVVEAFEGTVDVEAVDDAEAGAVAHVVAEATEEFIDDVGILDIIFTGPDAEALVFAEGACRAVEGEVDGGVSVVVAEVEIEGGFLDRVGGPG